MRYSLFKYGTGVLYGLTTSVTNLSPDTGPSTGGNTFILTGAGFDPRIWDDLFTAGALDPTLWTDLTSGSGVLTTGSPSLSLSSGATAGSIAGVESLANWDNMQCEIRCTIPRYTIYPASEVRCIALELYVSATDLCRLSILCGTSAASIRILAEVYRGGNLVDSYTQSWTSGTTLLKILRWGNDIYFIANGDILYRNYEFITDYATSRFYVDNVAENYDVYNTQIDWFYFRPFVVFGDQPVHDTVIVSNYRARGVVPPSIDLMHNEASYAGYVDCSIVGFDTITATDIYLYYYLKGLALIDSTAQSIKFSLVGDNQVVTPDNKSKGLGDGK